MKKILITFALSLIGFGQAAGSSVSQVDRLKGHYIGTYSDARLNAKFRLTIREDGTAHYRDNSSYGPYCDGEVTKDTSEEVGIVFKCNIKMQRKSGSYEKDTKFMLVIQNPQDVKNKAGKQTIQIYSTIVGKNQVEIYKLSDELFSDVLSSPEGFEGGFTLGQNGTTNRLIGYLDFKLQANNKLLVTSGYLKSEAGYRNVFGDEAYLVGSYSVNGKKITLKVKDDSGVSVSITMNWENILNKKIYNYNIALPKYIRTETNTDVVIDGETFRAGMRGPRFYYLRNKISTN